MSEHHSQRSSSELQSISECSDQALIQGHATAMQDFDASRRSSESGGQGHAKSLDYSDRQTARGHPRSCEAAERSSERVRAQLRGRIASARRVRWQTQALIALAGVLLNCSSLGSRYYSACGVAVVFGHTLLLIALPSSQSLLLRLASAWYAGLHLATLRRLHFADEAWGFRSHAGLALAGLVCAAGAVVTAFLAAAPRIPPPKRLNCLIGWMRLALGLRGAELVAHGLCLFGKGEVETQDAACKLAVAGSHLVCACVLLGPHARARAVELLTRLGATEEERAATLLASAIGHHRPSELLPMAAASFRSVRFDLLRPSDLDGSHPAASEGRAERCSLGQCDAFVSHAWSDPAGPKWDALAAWAADFERGHGRPPRLWLDRLCLAGDQRSASEALPCLPIYLSGCLVRLAAAAVGRQETSACAAEEYHLSSKRAADRSRATSLRSAYKETAARRFTAEGSEKVRNKLSKRQHEDEASWSTRSWLSLQAQRMSVALQLAAAEEIATELRLAAASEDAAVA
ncbi:hypothetical protein EMIHUDRAFT_106821 [Emiliania huxleyi CCMP1516]|uniref:Uncharacterized protein n=2 Tax=Emiliania huxleyi TaxID=2903 RepID=A0A0D3I5Q9_EMIH1|nr:hypothetical protein EMIHUDRAFT_106821 [Emiliania huxleyi CCMP1516]EOD06594.1 hypothetical protein EMIHUDRAFT_106821 [Emiliania huxleyi CCMP1516]|eukprot:XP_005759023.1 hypothetical protein EMIHUDRAFT_106821 [Emiliania huxleyi CCMP1516]